MIGREFHRIGENKSILTYFGDNRGNPFVGPGKIKFLDISTLGIIDKNGFHVLSVNGTINASISSDRKGIETKKKESIDEISEDEDTDEVKTTYLDIIFTDFCMVPLTRNLAICDGKTDTIKLVNRDDWTIERSLGQPNLQAAPIFSKLSCIDSFKINYKTYYSVAQLESDRVMIVSEGGNILHIIGESGILPGQFDVPTSIATCLLPEHLEIASQVSSPVLSPGWFMGQMSSDQLVKFMNKPINYYPNNFRICQRPKVPHIFDVVYISSGGILVNCQIQKDRSTGEVAMITATGNRLKSYPSVDHLVRNFSEFYKCFPDPRPYVSIAVLDSNNRRVQVFYFYWMESPLYRQEVQLKYVIGGYKSGCGVKLVQPTAVSYSSTGELAICDPGLKSVLLFSSSMLPLRNLNIPFINSIPKDDIPSPYHKFPPAPPYEQIPVDPTTQLPLPAGSPLTDRKPMDVAYSPDGKIAIMYRRGGILILKPTKIYNVGRFNFMPISCFDLILSFCEYSDYEALRECCVYFHNHTRKLRNQWLLAPLGTRVRETTAVYQFMKWAIAPFRNPVKFGINTPITPTDLTPLHRMVLYDCRGNECCSRYWIDGPMEPVTAETRSVFIKSRGNCCQNVVCSLSHDLPVIPYYFIKSLNASIDYQGTLLSICRLYGDEFIWKKEPYIQRLFQALSDKCNAEQRHDPMTRNNEVIREVIPTIEKKLDFDYFMEVMTICEEDFTEAKPFRQQFLFHRLRLEKALPPTLRENSLLSLLCESLVSGGNISNQINNDEDLTQLLHVDPIWQYKDGINVPHQKKLRKKHRQIKGVEKEERGIDTPDELVHNLSFIHKLDRAENMINHLFS